MKDSLSERVSIQMVGGDTLKITVYGLIPAKKNNKLLCRGRSITKPEYQKRINQITQDLRSAFIAFFQTSEQGTTMESSQPFWISWLPYDDRWTVVPSGWDEAELAEEGKERVEIYITKK